MANVTSCFVIFITIICTGDDLVSLHLLKAIWFTVTWFVLNKTITLLLNKIYILPAKSVFKLVCVCVFQSCGVVAGCNGGWEACVGAPPNRRVPAGHDSGHRYGCAHHRTSQSERKGKMTALLRLKGILLLAFNK